MCDFMCLGKRRGPYSSQVMLRWLHRGLLKPVLRVRSNQQDLVKTLTAALNPDGTPTEVDLFGAKAFMNGGGDGEGSKKKSKKRKRKPIDPVTLMPDEEFVVVSELETPFGVDCTLLLFFFFSFCACVFFVYIRVKCATNIWRGSTRNDIEPNAKVEKH